MRKELGHEAVVDQLIKAGADVNTWKSLEIALRNEHHAIVEMLRKAGAKE